MVPDPGQPGQMLTAIDTAAATGDHAALERLYSTARPFFTDQLQAKLAWAGHLDTLRFLSSLSPPAPLSAAALTLALEEQQTSTVAWLLDQGCQGESRTYDVCQTSRDWQMLMLLTRHLALPIEPTQALFWLDVGSDTGNSDIFKWYTDNFNSIHAADSRNVKEYCLTRVARHLEKRCFATTGHWHLAQWLVPRIPADGREGFLKACTEEAARQGRLDMLRWLLSLSNPPRLTTKITTAAAENPGLASLEYLRAVDPPAPWDLRCFEAAIQHGRAATLEWLRKHGCPVHINSLFQKVTLASVHHKALPWMAAHAPCQDQLEGCSSGRLIYLADSGWCMPSASMQRKLDLAREGYCAFYGVARWHAKQQSSQCSLGSLDIEILQRIACEAGVEYSVLYDDLPANPAKSPPQAMKHPSLLRMAEEALIDEEDTDASSSEDGDLQDPKDVLEAVACATALTDHAHGCWDGKQVLQLVKQGRAGTLWLACCAAGIDRSDDDSEDDCDWLPDA